MNASETESSPGRSGGQIALIVVGALAGLLALALLAGGGALVWGHATQRDAQGYYATGFKSLATPTYALVSDGLDVGTDGPDWLFRSGRLATVRVTATGGQAHPVFVGIARESDVDIYLGSVERDAVTDFEVDPFSVTYSRRPGETTPAAPATQTFWAAKSAGSGRQTVTWPVQKGSWDVVIMNADAARGIQSDVSVGAKVPFILWLGVGVLGLGALVAVVSGVAIYFGVRTRRTPQPDAAA
jgi:hypothetical protein